MYTLTYEGFTLYDPRLTDRDIYNVSTHLAVDEAGSMSFDMPPTHPHLSELAKLKGRLELCSDSIVLWRGRITEDSVDFDGVITIEAEGQLACLNDSIVEPYNFPEDYEGTDEYKSATNVVEFWLKKLLENHNSQVSEEQQIKLGTVTVSDPNNYFSRSCEDYSTTWDVVCDKLRDSSLGGHFLVRYESDGTYLDYVADYPLTNTQSVEFAQNLLDLTDELDATEVYTAILPVGKDGLTIASLPDGEVTTGLIKEGKVIYSTKGVENYGRITSVQTWDDVTEASNLRTKAATLLGSTGVMLSRSISVTAVDLHCTDETIASLRVGRYTPIVSEPHGLDVRYVLSELDLDIQDPGSTRLTFGATSKSMSDRANNLRANMRNVSDTANAATSTATAAQSAANTASSTANTALTAANSSVATVTTQYYDSTSATEMTGGSWSDTSPTWQEGHYIWSRTKTVSADGKTTEYSEAVCITGNTGKQGGTGSAMHWNLLSNTNTSSLVANISTSAGETSREFVDDETDANVKVLKLTSNLSSFTWWYLYVRQPSNIKKLIESGPDTLTVSMDIRINTDLPNTIFPFSIRDGNGANVAYDGPAMAYAFVKDTWKHCVWHMTKVAGQSYSAQALYSKLPKEFAQNGAIFELKNLKLEEGNTATEWCTTQAETIGADGTTYYTWIKYADSPTSGMSDNPSGKTYIGIAYNKTTATESTSYSDYSWSLIKGDKGATGAAGAAGVDYSQGKMLYTDPTFDTGVNSCIVYNHTGNGNVTITRSAKSSDNPFDKATYELVIANKGTASPGCGGFCWSNQSRANARFIYRIIAKIPTGYTLTWNANAYGSGGSVTSRTSMAGTGKFQEYVFEAKCGATGTFSTIGYFYLNGTVGTADNPVTWYVAYATCFDMTSSSDVQTAQSTADQANTDVQALSTTVVQNYVTSAQLDDRITSEVGTLATTIEGNKETIEDRVSDVEQKSGEWSATVSQHTESITKLQDDVLDVSTTVSKTMKLTEEGLTLSAGGSTNTVLITNDSINFKVGEYTAAYISDKQLWIKDAVIENSMTLGKFAFIPRDSGNLSLVRKDG